MEFHFATAWEAIADAIPDVPALTCGEVTRSWRAYDERAARLASALRAAGLGAGSRVGIYLRNSNEYLEAQFAAFKTGGCAVNIDCRHKADALVQLLDHAAVEALVYQSCHAARIWEIQKRVPSVKCFIEVADGTENIPVKGRLDYETAIREQPPLARSGDRRADDPWVLLTAGSNGSPKGVIHANGALCEAFVTAALRAHGMDPPGQLSGLADVVRSLVASGQRPVSLPVAPLTHRTGLWLGAMVPLLAGGTVVTIPGGAVDPDLIWDEVRAHRVTDIAIAGDAHAKPLLAALDMAARQGRPYDLSSLRRMVSSGVMWSAEVRRRLLAHHDMMLCDVLATAAGLLGGSVSTRAHVVATATFTAGPGVKVCADDGLEVGPGSGEVGEIASSGTVPVGHLEDTAQAAATLRDVDGVRHAFTGDLARVDAQGSITLLGRAAACIDIAGEQVFLSEIEEVVKLHPLVLDCIVIGHVQPPAQGETGAAVQVIALAAMDEDELEDATATAAAILQFTRARVRGSRYPARMLLVPEIRRSMNGKPDYGWARQEVTSQLH